MSDREGGSCIRLILMWSLAGTTDENTTESFCTNKQAAQLPLDGWHSQLIERRHVSTVTSVIKVEKFQQQDECPPRRSDNDWSLTGAADPLKKHSLNSPIWLQPRMNEAATLCDEYTNQYTNQCTSERMMQCRKASSRLVDAVGVVAPFHSGQHSSSQAEYAKHITELIDQFQKAS